MSALLELKRGGPKTQSGESLDCPSLLSDPIRVSPLSGSLLGLCKAEHLCVGVQGCVGQPWPSGALSG